MDLTLEPLNITKELILSKFSEEQLMEHYLGIRVSHGLFKSPLRKDDKPTCSFYRDSKGRLIFKDFSGCFHGDVIEVVKTKFNCSYYQALQIIANDFGIIHRPNLKVNKPKLEYTGSKLDSSKTAVIQVQIRDFQDYELLWWKKYGITQDTLNKFRVYSCKNVFLNGHLFHTETKGQYVFGYYGGIKQGIEQWRIYYPGRK